MSEDQIEFTRRVWWVYYVVYTGNYIFTSGFPPFDDKDILVNLPKNDFVWRYGGHVDSCDLEISPLNKFTNYLLKNSENSKFTPTSYPIQNSTNTKTQGLDKDTISNYVSICNDSSLKLESFPSDNYAFLICIYILFSRTSQLLNIRWLTKPKSQNYINSKFILLIAKVKSLKLKIETKYPSSIFNETINYYNTLSGFALIKSTEVA
ncbi:hypothetical protein AYI69_g8400, partial [Smittium culicis]